MPSEEGRAGREPRACRARATDGAGFSGAVRGGRKGREEAQNKTDILFKVSLVKGIAKLLGVNRVSLESKTVKGDSLKISHL